MSENPGLRRRSPNPNSPIPYSPALLSPYINPTPQLGLGYHDPLARYHQSSPNPNPKPEPDRIKIHQHRILIRPFDWSPRPAVQAHLFTLIDTPPLHLSVASLTTPTSELRLSPHQSPHSVDMGPIRNRTANQLESTVRVPPLSSRSGRLTGTASTPQHPSTCHQIHTVRTELRRFIALDHARKEIG